ncbi:MAG TPA: S49 family peptidase [Gemmataceae bacterium]|jgi:protease-4
MRSFRWYLVLAAGLSGCHHVFHIATDSVIRTDAPIATHSKVVSESPPVADVGPVVAMPLGGPCAGQEPKVAVVDVDGLLLNMDMTGMYSLGENPVSVFREKLDAIAADPCVCAVVVRINSPGGGVTATDILWRELHAFRAKARRPVVACLMDLGAGGAYYLATAADRIVAHPTSITGGIGVILNRYNLNGPMGYFSLQALPIKSGKHIDLGNEIVQEPAPERKQLLQAMADEFHNRFREVVAHARLGIDAADSTLFDGRVFTANQALERHLIDRIGYLDDAIATARELAHVESVRVVLYHRCNDRAHSAYAITPNVPLQNALLPISVPGLDRSRLPTFLYMWQPDPTLEKLGGR